MKKIPWKPIALVSVGMVVLIVARSAVTVGKSIYYGYDWYVDLVEDPWFYAGMAIAAVGLGSMIAHGIQCRKTNRQAPEEQEQQDQA